MKRILPCILAALLLAVPVSATANAAPARTMATPKAKTAMVTYQVNMHCHNCVNKLSENLSFLKGVKKVDISLDQKTVAVTYDPSKTTEEAFEKVIAKLGYKAVRQ